MKIEVFKYTQKDKDIYIFFADPNYIKKLVKISDISLGDKNFQRPYDEKRVNEIKSYVLGKDKLYKKGKSVYAKGYIPNAIVLNLSPKKYKIKKHDDKLYIDFPNNKEVKKYADTIEVIDGQHRLLAFDDDCKQKIKKDYNMCFVALIGLSNDEKKEIFMVLNERQKTVDKNILLRHKKLLNLLLDEEETRYETIIRLNNEKDSPFHNRVIIAGEKKKYGLKTTQMNLIIDSSKVLGSLIDSKGQMSDKNYKVFKNYLNAWKENFSTVWFKKNNTITKIAGFRFICYLFPYIHDILKSTDEGKDFRTKAFSPIIKKLKDDEFNDEFDIEKADKFQFFQEKSGIVKLANKLGKELQEHYQEKEKDILV